PAAPRCRLPKLQVVGSNPIARSGSSWVVVVGRPRYDSQMPTRRQTKLREWSVDASETVLAALDAAVEEDRPALRQLRETLRALPRHPRRSEAFVELHERIGPLVARYRSLEGVYAELAVWMTGGIVPPD